MVRNLLLIVALSFSGFAQSISITAPTENSTISGTAYALTSSLTSLPSVYTVTYYLNGVIDNAHLACLSRTTPYSCLWNTYYVFGGKYETLTAIATDANNVVLATSSAVTFTVTNSEPASTFSWTISAPSSPWTGTITITPTYSGTHASAGYMNCFVDGQLQFQNQTGAGTIKTTLFDNGSHIVRCNGLDQNSSNSNLRELQEWERVITFSNRSAAAELRLFPGYEVFLCVNETFNCPSTIVITGKVFNTDASSSSAIFLSEPVISGVAYPTAPVTLSACSSCTSVTISAQTVGTVPITFTESGGKTRMLWANVNTSNILPHFGTDGNIYKTYNSDKSFLSVALMNSSGDYLASALSSYPSFTSMAQDMFDSGINTAEFSLPTVANLNINGTHITTQPEYAKAMASLVSSNKGEFGGYKLYSNYTGDNWTRTGEELYATNQGPWATWSPSAMETAIRSLINSGSVIAFHGGDEVNSAWQSTPLATINWLNGLNGLTCVSGGNCTVTCTNYFQSKGLTFTTGCPFNSALKFNITGSGDSNLDLNTTGRNPAPPYSVTGRMNAPNGGLQSFTFPTPPGVGSRTYTSATNPGLTINWMGGETFDSSYFSSGQSSAHICPPNGSSAGPCPGFIRNDAFSQMMTQYYAATGGPTKPPVPTWDIQGGYTTGTIQNWMGDPQMAGMSMMYYLGNPGTPTSFMPGGGAVWNFGVTNGCCGIASNFRIRYSALNENRLAPIAGEVAGINNDYGFQGYPVTVTSVSGNLVTFTAPHGISNIRPWDTRLWISGNSNSAANTKLYVTDCPTSTTCHVAYAQWQFTASYDRSFTATVDNGDTFTATSIYSSSGSYFGSAIRSSSNPCIYENYRGHTLTITGTGTAFDSTTMYMIPAPFGAGGCGLSTGDGAIGQIPNFSSGTGGTATIVKDNGYERGVNRTLFASEAGPRYIFGSFALNVLLGAAQTRIYSGAIWEESNIAYTTIFNDTSPYTFQSPTHPRFGQYDGAQKTWQANTIAAKIFQRLVPCLFEPRSSAPDYGQFFESTVRLSSTCNLLAVESLADGPLTRSIDLTPIAVSGQATVKYCAGWKGIAVNSIPAGTTSDLNTFDPDACAVAAYVGAPNAANWYSPPVIAARLADVPNASSIAIQWTYSPIQFSASQVNDQMLYQTYNIGAGTGTAPIDRQIGTVYYRLLYLGANSAVLGTSDVQTF